MTMQQLYAVVPVVPLIASIIVGLWGNKMPRAASHWITIIAVAISFVASVVIWRDVLAGHSFNGDIYTWAAVGDLRMTITFFRLRKMPAMLIANRIAPNTR